MKRIPYIIAWHLLPLLIFGQKSELVVPIGHTSGEVSATFSPNGDLILTHSSDDPMAKLWDLNGHELQSFQHEKAKNVSSATFSPDGKNILIHFSFETEDYEPRSLVHAWNLNGEPLTAFDAMMDEVTYATFTPDGQSVITGSVDGIIKVWDLNGRLRQSFPAHNSGISAIAISPDEQFLVTVSLDENTREPSQKLWELGRQKMVRDLSGYASLVFAPNSQFLLDKGFFWREDSPSLIGLDGDPLQVFDGITRADFSPDGRFLILEDRSGAVRTWEIATGTFREFQPGTIITFSPDGRYLLRGHAQEESVELLTIRSGESKTFDGFPQGVREIAFSPDGTLFLANAYDGATSTLRLSTIETGRLTVSKSFGGRVALLGFSPDQQSLLIRNGRDEIVVLNRQLILIGSLRGYTNELSDVFFSEDNTSIIIEDYPVSKRWNLESNDIQPSNESKPFYAGYTGDVLWSPDRQYIFGADADDATPALYPQTEEAMEAVSLPDEDSGAGFVGHTSSISSVAFSADGQFILTGSTDKTARLWNLFGQNLQTFENHADGVRSVGFRPDKRLILTGTKKLIKLWRPNSPRELITLIPVDTTDWIVTTPSGLFDASPRALNLMHFRLFYPEEQTYIVIDIEQLKARYYEPGLLQKVLGYSSERIRPVEVFDAIKLYPKVAARIVQDSLLIDLQARNGGIGKVSIFINGKEIVEEVNPLPRRENARRDSMIRFDLKPHQNFLFRHPDSTNTITIRAYNKEGWLKSPAINLDYQQPTVRSRGSDSTTGSSSWVGQLDPKLYVVAIGTSDYTGTKMDLQYADQDATMMAKALQSVGTALFTAHGDSLEVHCLSTANADSTGLEGTPIHWQFAEKTNIKATFDAIKRRAKAEDVIVVYLSGHGVTQGGMDQTQFYYLTQGVASEDDLVDPATLRTYTISSEELTRWINDIPALKQVLIIDACNSGQIVENLTGGTKSLNSSQIRALDRMKDRTGMFVLSGSASDKVSYEAGEYGQGLLTYALLEGMRGVATRRDNDGKEVIDVMKLFQHARDRVPELAATINGVQTPMLGFPRQGASFDIGILNETAKAGIPIGNKKPVVVKSFFLDQNTFQDDLRLAELLEVELRKETKKGSAADLIYVDVYDYPGAYSLSGLYSATAEEIKIMVKLFRDRKDPIELELRPTNDPEQLVRLMVREIKRLLQ